MHGHPESILASETPSLAGQNPSPCSGCTLDACTAEDRSEPSLFSGWRLGLASTGLFLGPVALAILGAACLSSSPGGQFAGAIAGLSLGLVGSVGLARIRHRGREKHL